MLSVRLRENQCQGPGQGQGRDKGLPTMSHSQMKYGFPTRFTKVKHSPINFINAKAEALISICLCLIRLSQLLQNSEDKANAFIGP